MAEVLTDKSGAVVGTRPDCPLGLAAETVSPASPVAATASDDLNRRAAGLVRDYIRTSLALAPEQLPFETFVVWQCHILGNRKWLVSTTLRDGLYYEVTYDGAKRAFYLDVYRKQANLCFPEPRPEEVG